MTIATGKVEDKTMASVYEARKANARNIAKSLIQFQELGYIIITDLNEVVTGKITWDEDEGLFIGISEHGRIHYFNCDIEFDDGMHTPIDDFNAQFDGWRIFDPKSVIRVVQKKQELKA